MKSKTQALGFFYFYFVNKNNFDEQHLTNQNDYKKSSIDF